MVDDLPVITNHTHTYKSCVYGKIQKNPFPKSVLKKSYKSFGISPFRHLYANEH